ncbi:MAG: glycosyltransferase family 2 protein [Anaerolineae bacterium]|nr:glycosyltransferase family 2 protein [Anaerolineae bacterium]NUQ06064.1 glycosyltransferase family 2 protein [Anaerolineae bacterium]
MRIDLILLDAPPSNVPFHWSLGEVHHAALQTLSLVELTRRVTAAARAAAVLYWDAALGAPDPQTVMRTAALPGTLWHAGLRLGTGGQPRIIDHILPLWMLNADPDAGIETTSWRLSLRACLIPTAALRHLGGIHAGFETPTAAALDLGFRAVSAGMVPRHIPSLLPSGITAAGREPHDLPLEDELLFARRNFKTWQYFWGALRIFSAGSQRVSALKPILATLRSASGSAVTPYPHPEMSSQTDAFSAAPSARITVLIPTIDRYPYLRTLLAQFRTQTLPPHEIIIVDQTEPERRDSKLVADFPDLPIRLFVMDQAGQCRSRNLGLQESTGDYIMFLDDDVEIPPDLLEKHLENLQRFRADVSSGSVFEPPQTPQECQKDRIRASDVFPTNITLIRREILKNSGLFDLAFDHRSRADHDLGTRIYLSGGVMMMDERTPILHHHAPRGGLRTHGARVVTGVSSRRSIFQRNLITASSHYIGLRYFSEAHTREQALLSVLMTTRSEGNFAMKLIRLLVAVIQFVDTRKKLNANLREAKAMMAEYPQIPVLKRGPDGGFRSEDQSE